MSAKTNKKTSFFAVSFVLSYCLIIVGMFVSVVCGSGSPAENTPITPEQKPIYDDTGRFTVHSFGRFYGGFDNNEREIFIITDTTTKKQYLAITGCGTTELKLKVSDKFTNTVEE
jgi:hypothetical protein